MDEEEIDSWYDEEKEKAMSEYLEELDKNKNSKEVEDKYKTKSRLLREKYTTMYEKSIKRKKRVDGLLKKVEKIKDNILRVVPWVKK